MNTFHWLMDNASFIAGAVLCLIGVVVGLSALISGSNRAQAYDDLREATRIADENAVPINTWRDDFGAWKHGDISIEEFLDRRWAFRQSK